MFVVTNQHVVRRQMRRGNLFLVAALLVFGTGVIVNWNNPQDELASTFSLAALILGIFFWQVHQYYARRYGARFRLDNVLAHALRGLGNRYYLVCFASPRLPDYVLLGPHGVAVLVARAVNGTIKFQRGKWSRAETPFWLKLIGADPLRDPSAEAQQGIARLGEHLRAIPDLGEVGEMPVEALIAFTPESVVLEIEDCPYAVLRAADVSAYLHQKKGTVPAPLVERLRDWLIPPDQATTPQPSTRPGLRPGARRRPPSRR